MLNWDYAVLCSFWTLNVHVYLYQPSGCHIRICCLSE